METIFDLYKSLQTASNSLFGSTALEARSIPSFDTKNLFKSALPRSFVLPESTDSRCSSITFSQKWTISNYSLQYDEGYAWKWQICPSHFSPPNNELFKFDLHFHPKSELENYVELGVFVNDIPQIYNGKIRCGWSVSIVDENGDKCETRDIGLYCLFRETGKEIYNFIEYSKLFNCASKYLPNDQLTLHFEFHLQADEPIFNVITNNEVGWSRFDCSQKVNRVVHTWTIENFTHLFVSNNIAPCFIASDDFPKLEGQIGRLFLVLHPNGWNGESNENVDILLSDIRTNVTVHGRVSILDVDGEECCIKECIRKMPYDSKNSIYCEYNRAYLLNNSDGLINQGKLTINFEMTSMIHSSIDNKLANHLQMSGTVCKSESNIDIAQKQVHFFTHQWTIDKFSALCLNSPKKHYIDSKITAANRFKFRLRLRPKGCNNKYASLNLAIFPKENDKATAQFRLSILGSNGAMLNIKIYQNVIPDYGTVFVNDSEFFKLSILQNSSLVRRYLPNGRLTIISEIWIVQDKKSYKTKSISTPPLVNNPSGSGATFNMANANLQGAIINVQSVSSVSDFNVKATSNDEKLKKQ